MGALEKQENPGGIHELSDRGITKIHPETQHRIC
jgi:hypothetical protein